MTSAERREKVPTQSPTMTYGNSWLGIHPPQSPDAWRYKYYTKVHLQELFVFIQSFPGVPAQSEAEWKRKLVPCTRETFAVKTIKAMTLVLPR